MEYIFVDGSKIRNDSKDYLNMIKGRSSKRVEMSVLVSKLWLHLK